MLIIGLGHKKGVGKDTFAGFLATALRMECRDKDIRVASFADPLKEICHKLYGWAGVKGKNYYNIHRDERDVFLPKIGMTVRELWIKVGTPAFREQVFEDTWILYTLNLVADILIIPDVRFPNEVKAIHEKEGYVFKIENKHILQTNDIADCALDDFDGWNGIIGNHDSKQGLYSKAEALARSLRV